MKNLNRLSLFPTLFSMIFLAFSLPARAQTIVCLTTTLGDVCMELLETDAPATTQNFLAYVNQGSYKNSFFHHMETDGPTYVQAGQYIDTKTGDLDGLVKIVRRPAISNESSLSNIRGTVAMVPDDPNDPDSITSQFLINLEDNSATLDNENGGYPVFARIIGDGMLALEVMPLFTTIAFNSDDLSQVPVIGEEVPILNSPRVEIFDAYVYDGDITDFEPADDGSGDGSSDGSGDSGSGDGSGDDGGSSGDGSTDDGSTGSGDSGGDTPVPGEGQTLYQDAVCVDTNVGEFCMELLPDIAPVTVANFLNYVNSGRYDDTIIHRTVPNFVIQGGGYYSDPLGDPVPKDEAIVNEFSRSNLRGTVAMARLGGSVDSATSEWYVNLADNSDPLDTTDEGFTVFGEIVSGMSVVDAIAALPRSNQAATLGGAFGELPLTGTDADGVTADDLVLVHRIYVTDLIVDDVVEIVATAQYSSVSDSFSLPVWIGDNLYRVIMFHDPEAEGIVFKVDTTRIVSLSDTGQDTATMDLDAGVLTIPSIKVGGTTFTDLVFDLTDFETLEFTLKSFTRP